jgi:hypothetical protein
MMNERIKELAEQARIKVWHNGGGLLSDKAFEIVAELIVRECAHLVGGYTKENEFGTDVKEAYEEITKHFGVEE